MIKKYLHNLYKEAEDLNTLNVKNALSITGPHESLLDVGCWDGEASKDWIESSKATKVYGIEPVSSAAKKAEAKGIKVFTIEAERDNWPLESNSVDCVISNQVVEHLSNLDHYFSEAHRVLKPGGYLITSTNNLSSLHNIFSLILGYAPFDLTNSSSKKIGIGNPFAIHKGEEDLRGSSWTHKCIYTPRWLKDWQEAYKFKFIDFYGSGFYPLPAFFGKVFKNHSAFITIISQKK